RFFEEAEFLVEFDQLVGRARAITFGLRAADIGIIELPLQPARRRRGAPPRGLYPLVQSAAPASAPTAPLAAHLRYSRRITGTVRPCPASVRKMPSRMPRSATPTRAAGQRSMMPS